MYAFGVAMKSENEFLGYHGDFEKGAEACFKTAGVFAAIGAVSFVFFVAGAVHSKMRSAPESVSMYERYELA